MSNIFHPLPLNTKVRASKPSCPCKGAQIIVVEGTVAKIINNNSGTWYYLKEPGVTVKSEWVTNII